MLCIAMVAMAGGVEQHQGKGQNLNVHSKVLSTGKRHSTELLSVVVVVGECFFSVHYTSHIVHILHSLLTKYFSPGTYELPFAHTSHLTNSSNSSSTGQKPEENGSRTIKVHAGANVFSSW